MAIHPPAWSKRSWGVAWVGLAALGWSCSRSPTNSPAGAPPLTPHQTLTRLIAGRAARQYTELQGLVCPGHGHEVVETLVAVDDLLAANQTLGEVLRQRGFSGLAQTIDQSYLADHLDVFSPYVELLDEVITGDTAAVSFTSDGRLPARQARLRRVDGAWRYDPGPGYDPNLPEAFHRIAKGLRQVADDLEGGRPSATELRDAPDRFIDRVRIAMLPGVKLLPAPK
jgi:hypothetical protein